MFCWYIYYFLYHLYICNKRLEELFHKYLSCDNLIGPLLDFCKNCQVCRLDNSLLLRLFNFRLTPFARWSVGHSYSGFYIMVATLLNNAAVNSIIAIPSLEIIALLCRVTHFLRKMQNFDMMLINYVANKHQYVHVLLLKS
jgi:hypothetical protein